jgi:hypothetical protein
MEASLVRIAVEPSPRNGLRKPSQLMVDKLFTVPIEAVNSIWPCADGWSCRELGRPSDGQHQSRRR